MQCVTYDVKLSGKAALRAMVSVIDFWSWKVGSGVAEGGFAGVCDSKILEVLKPDSLL